MTKINLIFFCINVIIFISLLYRHYSLTNITTTNYNNHISPINNDNIRITENDSTKRRRLQSNDTSDNITHIYRFNPLDPLTSHELTIAVNIIKTRLRIDLNNSDILRIHSYSNILPDKYKVIDYLNNPETNLTENDFNRMIDMDISILLNDGVRRKLYNTIIDITNYDVIKLNVLSGKTGYPQMIAEDGSIANQIILSNPSIINYFTNTLGIPLDHISTGQIFCSLASPFSNYYISILKQKIPLIEFYFYFYRIASVACFDATYVVENIYQNQLPFLGLINLDLNNTIYWWKCDDIEMNIDCITAKEYYMDFYWSNKIDNIILETFFGVNDSIINECARNRNRGNARQRPIMYMGTSDLTNHTWMYDYHTFRWQGWEFHEQLMNREGPRLSNIRFNNRSIAYDMVLSDMYVPYHDLNSIQWYAKGFLDIGHYGAGLITTTRISLNHTECPAESLYLDQETMDEHGNIITSPIYACLFELWDGEPRVRHGGPVSNTAPNIMLVYRTIYTIGNYDYLVSYIFRLDGSIKIKVGATGYNLVSQVKNDDTSKTNQYNYCNKVSGIYCSPFHDHYFGFRIDLDIDEPYNNFYKGKVKVIEENVNNIRNNGFNKRHAFGYDEQLIKTEKESGSTKNPKTPTNWVIRSTSSKYYNNDIGYQTGYELLPSQQSILLWDALTDIRDNMASWTMNGLWISKYKSNELYISGKYTWQPIPLQGLNEYINDNENIEKSDIVAWITMGFHHVTRSDDIPVAYIMPNEFVIKPFNFFKFSPATCGDDIV